ncbi:MAG: BTAD domain-containing putative transcriptional regulator [Gemmatimonadota bacterium]
MKVMVLGPIELRSDAGVAVSPRGARQRLLLAVLLRRAPRAVPVDTLMDVVWGEQLPDNPRAALRTQLSRLRGLLLRVGGGERLQRDSSGGCLLRLDPEELDVTRFVRLQKEAREAVDPEESLALANDGLSLWRDQPYGELHDHPTLIGETTRLRELHTGLQEHRVECLLSLARTAEALAAAELLVDAEPLRESTRALLMQALYRAGRQAEALATFQRYRQRLSEELGLAPSPSLRALEGELLQHEGAVALPVVHPVGARSRTPLPFPLTSLIGRDHDREEVTRLLRSARLVTLVGPPGCGKTRLALAVAREMQEEVIWVELGAVTETALVAQEAAVAAGVREHPGRSDTEALRRAVAGRPAVLVLDNCEHLLGACATLAVELLRDCPELTVLATSREPLSLSSEQIWHVMPLPIPPEATPLSEHSGYASVELFRERARSASRRFVLDSANFEAVGTVCRRLDGIPLALELAAARVRHLEPAEIAARLEQDLGLLAGGRDAPPRHRTLNAAIDWSYRLLSGRERALLERLSVFAGTFNLAAAEAVCADDAALPASEVSDLLFGLVDRSFVIAQANRGSTRYRLLETVRSFARERLEGSGGAMATYLRHVQYFAALAESAADLLVSPRRAETGRRLAADHENISAALAWALAHPAGAETACRLTGSLWWFWHYAGRFEEAWRCAHAALVLIGSAPSERSRAKVLYTAAMASWMRGEPALASNLAEQAVAVAEEVGDPQLLVRCTSAQALALRDVGEVTRARELAGVCVAIAQNAGFPPTEMGFALWIQCTALLDAGDVKSAEAAARKAEALWRQSGDRWGLAMVLHGMGMAQLGRGRLEPAAAYFREAMELLRRDGEPYFLARCIEGLAIVLVHQDDAERASCLFGAAEAIRETIGAPLLALEERRYRHTVAQLVPLLPERRRAGAWAEGRAMDLEQAVVYALAEAPTA